MTKYYYVTNRDGTTYNGFIPFENDPDYAEAPDWIDGDDIDCGNALHVVSDNPCEVFTLITRNHPVAHEVEPVDLKPQRAGKFRCRALKRIRTLSDGEFAEFFIKFNFGDYYVNNKANVSCENGHLICLNKCIEIDIMPTSTGANLAAHNGHLDCLNRCIEIGMLPTVIGANWAAGDGYLDCLNKCIEIGALPTSQGSNWACSKNQLDCLNRCIEIGVLPTSTGADWASANGYLNILNMCIELGILPTSWGASAAAQNDHLDIVNRCIEVGIHPSEKGNNYD